MERGQPIDKKLPVFWILESENVYEKMTKNGQNHESEHNFWADEQKRGEAELLWGEEIVRWWYD